MKVLHIITGLGQGGAESVLFRLIVHGSPDIEHEVVSLTSLSEFGPMLESRGISVTALNLDCGGRSLARAVALYRIIKDSGADIVQTWMYHADLIGGSIARIAGVSNVVWGIRLGSPWATSRTTLQVARASALLSPVVPTQIISCSRRGVDNHRRMGYTNRFVVIPNGFDTSVYAPDFAARTRIRHEWLLSPNEPAVGMVARWDAQKGHGTLLDALQRVRERYDAVRLVLVGRHCDTRNAVLGEMLRARRLSDVVHLAGARTDIPAVMNALDVHVLSSVDEGFPNVIGEAMACGTPCVATDVGDVALLIDECTGWLVKPQSSQSLADGLLEALGELQGCTGAWKQRQLNCRNRIVDRYDIGRMIAAYESAWCSLMRPSTEGRA